MVTVTTISDGVMAAPVSKGKERVGFESVLPENSSAYRRHVATFKENSAQVDLIKKMLSGVL